MRKPSNDLKDLGILKKYEKIYDWNDIVLYNSYYQDDKEIELQKKWIMSNFYSPCNIEYKGMIFNSSEQLYFYRRISEWGKEYQETSSVLEEIMKCENGKQVKKNEDVRKLSDKIDRHLEKEIGEEKHAINDWKLMYECIRLKYKYCKEFREVLERFKDKILVEDSMWGDNWAGALWDKKIGKYRGANVCGRAMMRVYKERDKIMREG